MGKPFVLNWCMHMERTHTLGMAMAPTLRQNINHNDSFQIKNTTTNYNEYQLNWTERYFSRKKVHKYEYGMTDVFGILKLQVHLFNQLILIIGVDGVMFENQIQINGMALHGIRENEMKWMNETSWWWWSWCWFIIFMKK